jgi:hypothetical protein
VGIHTDSDLTFGVDATLGTVTRVGDLVIIRTEDPVGVWDAVTTSVSTGQRAIAAVAEELAAQGITVEITGPEGLVARIGAGIDSSRGLLAAGSRKIELGERRAIASLVRVRLRRADPRVGAAAAGALVAGGAVVFGLRRRRRKGRWERRRDQASAAVSATVAEAATRGRAAVPLLISGYEQVRDATAPRVSAVLDQARETGVPKALSAAEQARDIALPRATSALEQARDSWQRSGAQERLDATRAVVEPHLAAARKAAEPKIHAALVAAQPVLEEAATRGREFAGHARDYAVNDAMPLAQDIAHRARLLAEQNAPAARALATRGAEATREAAKQAQALARDAQKSGRKRGRRWRRKHGR